MGILSLCQSELKMVTLWLFPSWYLNRFALAPTPRAISFIFMQFLANILPNKRLAHPTLGLPKALWEILDPPLFWITYSDFPYTCDKK